MYLNNFKDTKNKNEYFNCKLNLDYFKTIPKQESIKQRIMNTLNKNINFKEVEY